MYVELQSMVPASSWQEIMEELQKLFGNESQIARIEIYAMAACCAENNSFTKATLF
jgi:hypothetical protein